MFFDAGAKLLQFGLLVGFRAGDLAVTSEDLNDPQIVTRFELLSDHILTDAQRQKTLASLQVARTIQQPTNAMPIQRFAVTGKDQLTGIGTVTEQVRTVVLHVVVDDHYLRGHQR